MALLFRDSRARVDLRLASLRALLGRNSRAHAAAPRVALNRVSHPAPKDLLG